PFEFDLVAGLTRSGGSSSSGSAAPAALAEEVSSGGGSLIPLGVGALLLAGVVTAGLFVAAMLSGPQIPALESKRDGVKMEVGTLESRQQELRQKAELDRALLDMIQKAKIRNQVYVALTNDLKDKTPEKIWIRSLSVDDSLELSGKALSHQSVINL